MYLDLVKIFVPTALAFFFGLFLTPIATHFFYKYKMWKKYSRSEGVTVSDFKKIHNENAELHTPRVGGMIIWLSVCVTTIIFYCISISSTSLLHDKLNFLSRNQTIIPFFTLLLGSLIGLWDDLIQIYGSGRFARDDKSWRKWKAFLIALMSFLIGFWFYFKLGMDAVTYHLGGVCI